MSPKGAISVIKIWGRNYDFRWKTDKSCSACGEGPNGKKQYYDWERYYGVIRKLQPDACISVCGPDIRWCGNEAGHTRVSEWSVVPERAKDSDLGSRAVLENEDELIWYPAEVNISIRPGWFFRQRRYWSGKNRWLQRILYCRERQADCWDHRWMEQPRYSRMHCSKGKYSLQPARGKLFRRSRA